MNKIETFIRKRFQNDCNWLTGNCYYFAIILKERFGGSIMYDTIYGHFVTKIKGKLYDWKGLYKPKGDECFEYWPESIDSLRKQRIIHDCIL